MSDWYYAVDSEQKGPINESELKENLAANKIPADSLVWKDGMDNWTPANQVPAFSFRQPPIPAKVQPGDATTSAPASKTTTEAPAASVPNPDSTTPVTFASLWGTPQSLEVDFDDAEKNKPFGIMAYVPIPIPIWWLIGMIWGKTSPFAKYHVNQGLVLGILWFICVIVLWIVGDVFASLPSILYWIFTLLRLVYIGPLILSILGIVNAAAGKCVPLPVIGGIKLIK